MSWLPYNPRVAKLIEIHPTDPQPRLVKTIVEIIHSGGLVAYPTDSSYALGCHIGDKKAIERIHRIRRTHKKHNFTLVCADLSEISAYARVDNWAYRMIKSMTPGPYTFVLPATREVPKRLQNPKRRTIGLRVPDHALVRAVLEALGERLGIDAVRAAEGVHRVISTHMAEGIRLATVRRGVDPRRFTLLGFGGAAGLASSSRLSELCPGMSQVATRVTPARRSTSAALASNGRPAWKRSSSICAAKCGATCAPMPGAGFSTAPMRASTRSCRSAC